MRWLSDDTVHFREWPFFLPVQIEDDRVDLAHHVRRDPKSEHGDRYAQVELRQADRLQFRSERSDRRQPPMKRQCVDSVKRIRIHVSAAASKSFPRSSAPGEKPSSGKASILPMNCMQHQLRATNHLNEGLRQCLGRFGRTHKPKAAEPMR